MQGESFLFSSSYDLINNNSKPARSSLTFLCGLKIKTLFIMEIFKRAEKQSDENKEPLSTH